MFAIKVQDGEAVTMCYSDWEETPHSGNLRVSDAFSPGLKKINKKNQQSSPSCFESIGKPLKNLAVRLFIMND